MRGTVGGAEAGGEGAGEGMEEPISEPPDGGLGRPAFRPVLEGADTGLCSFERGERFYFVALSFGGFPEIALGLKVKPEVGVGVEGLR